MDDHDLIEATIVAAQPADDHIEYVIRVERVATNANGAPSRVASQVIYRYSEFATLDGHLRSLGVTHLPLPSKRLLGNMAPEFVAERQAGLQAFLHTLTANPMLCSTLLVRRFLDPKSYLRFNHPEWAIQRISMLFRSEPGWEAIGEFSTIGWRISKSYFETRPSSKNSRQKYCLHWLDNGPDHRLSSKDLTSVIKILQSIKHPNIVPIVHFMADDRGLLVIQNLYKLGSLKDLIHQSAPTKQSYLKKYWRAGEPSGKNRRDMSADTAAAADATPVLQNHFCSPLLPVLPPALVKLFGEQILEALVYLHSKQIHFGHLHSGNVLLLDEDQCALSDLENAYMGVSCFYRPFLLQLPRIQTAEAIDIYCFGHVLFEMIFGQVLFEATLPPDLDSLLDAFLPKSIATLLRSLLSKEGIKALPTVVDLLNHELFIQPAFPVKEGSVSMLKPSDRVRQLMGDARAAIESRLRNDQRAAAMERRRSRVEQLRQRNDDQVVEQQTLRLATAVIGSDGASSEAPTSTADTNTATPCRPATSALPSPVAKA